MFWKLMAIALAVMVVGWIGYFIYWYIVLRPEEKTPQKPKRLDQANDSMSDYAKKMTNFEKKRYDKQ